MKVPWFTMYYNWSVRILKCLHLAVAVYFKYQHLCTSAEEQRNPTWWREELSHGGKTRTKFDSTIQPGGVCGAQPTSRDSLHPFTSLFSRQTESFEVTGWEISLALQAPQKRRKCDWIIHKGRKKSGDFPPMTSATIAGVTLDRVSRTPLCLDLSARVPVDSFTCAHHADTSSSSSSLALSPQLCLTSSHPRPSPDPLQGFTSPPLSSSQQLLLLQLVAQPWTRLLVLNAALSPPLSPSLSFPHPPLQRALSHSYAFTHSGSPSATHMLQATAEPTHVLDTY